jgi:hypothetical protein
VLTTFDSQAADGNRLPCELLVLDGRDGSKRWSQPWNMISQWSELHLWPPLLIDADGAGKRTLALGELWSDAKQGAKVEFFDSNGKVTQTLPTISMYRGDTAWCALDLDGDGKESLLYPSAKGLCAYRLHDKKTLWTWGAGLFAHPLPNWGADAFLGQGSFGPGTGFAVDVEELHRSPQPPLAKGGNGGVAATLIVRTGRERSQPGQTAFYGLNATTGAARWRCDTPRHHKQAHVFHSVVAYAAETDDLPLVVTHPHDWLHTTVQRPLPADAEGFYLPPKGQSVVFAEFADPEKYRSLPWVADPWSVMPRWLFHEPTHDPTEGPDARPPSGGQSILGILISHLFVVFLSMLVYLSWQGTWRQVLGYLLLALIASVVIGAIMLWVDASRFKIDQEYSWSRWYWILYQGSTVLGGLTLVGVVVRWFVKKVRRSGGTP